MLDYLLSNAARYSGDSSPIVLSAGRQGIHFALSVSDQGGGISTEELPHLLRKYVRRDGESRGRDLGASGLGLAICKRVVEAHDGRIRAESEGPDLGSRFTLTLPVVEEFGSGDADFDYVRDLNLRRRPTTVRLPACNADHVVSSR